MWSCFIVMQHRKRQMWFFLKSIKKVLITCKFIRTDNGKEGLQRPLLPPVDHVNQQGYYMLELIWVHKFWWPFLKINIISSCDVIGNHHTNYILYQIDMLMKCKTRCRKTFFPLNIYFSYGKVYHSMGMLILIFNYKNFSIRLIHS